MIAEHRRLFRAYWTARDAIKRAGFERDIDWAYSLEYVKPTPLYVMEETAWVIYNSGFRYSIVRAKWPAIFEGFLHFDPARIDDRCVPLAMAQIRNERKARAVVDVAAILRAEGIATIVADAHDPPRLCRLPYIGKVTCWHLAKVLGADVVKPDVHLLRAAKAAGYPTPRALCEAIREAAGGGRFGERLTVIDSVLWRYGEQQKARGWASFEALFAEDAAPHAGTSP